MLISELAGMLDLACVQDRYKDRPILSGYCSDLLSDVMAHAQADSVLVTIQAHKNSVAVACLVGIAAILLCNGREAPPDMVEAARDEGIAVFSSRETQFELSGKLWSLFRAEAMGRNPELRG